MGFTILNLEAPAIALWSREMEKLTPESWALQFALSGHMSCNLCILAQQSLDSLCDASSWMKFCRPWDCDFWRWFVKGAAACRGFRPALIACSRAPIGWIPRSGSQPSCAKREETRERLPRPLTFPAQSVSPKLGPNTVANFAKEEWPSFLRPSFCWAVARSIFFSSPSTLSVAHPSSRSTTSAATPT